MSITLSDLKKNSKKNLESIIKESDKLNKGGKEKDDRYWQPTVDKAGNGYALIRFLPSPRVDGIDALPWVKFWDHGFQGPTGKWYIEKSRSSLGEPDPVMEYNSKLWATEDKDLQDQARKQKRRLKFVANILVVNDPANSENNGKVFLYTFGQKIFDKIKNVMSPDEDLGEEPNDPFNFWTGQNFKLKIKNVAGYRNYDDSAFAAPSEISNDDARIEDIWNAEHSLKEFVDPAQYKPYDELKKKLYDVLDIQEEGTVSRTAERMAQKMDDTVNASDDDMDLGLDGDDDSSLDDILKDL